MQFESLLPGVTTSIVRSARMKADPLYSNEEMGANRNEFILSIKGTGDFYVHDGSHVEIAPDEGADHEWIRLYLNGQVLVALLHQRKIINFHASSFIHNGRGIMVLGETGAGKSSVTVAFGLYGSGFLSDDLTPVIFKDGHPCLWPLNRDVKIRKDTVSQLKIGEEKLREAEPGTGKKYLRMAHSSVEDHPLHTVLKIETGKVGKPEFSEPSPAEKFSLLRSEVCSWEMLAGMPETEKEYLHHLLEIVKQVNIFRIVRPDKIEISAFQSAIELFLTTESH